MKNRISSIKNKKILHLASLKSLLMLSLGLVLSVLIISCARSLDTYEQKNKEVYYTVIFDLDGAGYLNSLKVLKGEKVTKPEDPTNTGVSFIDWFKDKEKTIVFDFNTENITANTTIYAKWGEKTYTVTYNTDGGSNVPSQRIEKGRKITPIPDNPNKTGETFVNWYKDIGKTEVFNFTIETITTNITIYAKWEINKFTVSYNTDGGTAIPSVLVAVNGKISPKPADPTKPEFTFVNWYKDAEKTILFNFTLETITSNITIYAKWQVI